MPGHARCGQQLCQAHGPASTEGDHPLPGPARPNQQQDRRRRGEARPEAEGLGVEPGLPGRVGRSIRDWRFERCGHGCHVRRPGAPRNGERSRLTGQVRPEKPQGVPTTFDHDAARQAHPCPHHRGQKTGQGVEMRRAEPAPEAVGNRDLYQGQAHEGFAAPSGSPSNAGRDRRHPRA